MNGNRKKTYVRTKWKLICWKNSNGGKRNLRNWNENKSKLRGVIYNLAFCYIKIDNQRNRRIKTKQSYIVFLITWTLITGEGTWNKHYGEHKVIQGGSIHPPIKFPRSTKWMS